MRQFDAKPLKFIRENLEHYRALGIASESVLFADCAGSSSSVITHARLDGIYEKDKPATLNISLEDSGIFAGLPKLHAHLYDISLTEFIQLWEKFSAVQKETLKKCLNDPKDQNTFAYIIKYAEDSMSGAERALNSVARFKRILD